jgi:hypothetical protein
LCGKRREFATATGVDTEDERRDRMRSEEQRMEPHAVHKHCVCLSSFFASSREVDYFFIVLRNFIIT